MPSAAEAHQRTALEADTRDLLTVLEGIPLLKEILKLSKQMPRYQTAYVEALKNTENLDEWRGIQTSVSASTHGISHHLFGWQEKTTAALLETPHQLINQFDLLQACSSPFADAFQKPPTRTFLAETEYSKTWALQLFHSIIQNTGMKSSKKEAIISMAHKMLDFNKTELEKTAKQLLGAQLSFTDMLSFDEDAFQDWPADQQDMLNKLIGEFFSSKQEKDIDAILITYLKRKEKPKNPTDLLKICNEEGAGTPLEDKGKIESLFNGNQKTVLSHLLEEMNVFITQELQSLTSPSLFDTLQQPQVDASSTIHAFIDGWTGYNSDNKDKLRSLFDHGMTIEDAIELLEKQPYGGHNGISLLASTLLNINPSPTNIASLQEIWQGELPDVGLNLEEHKTINERTKACLVHIARMDPEFDEDKKARWIFMHSENITAEQDTLTHPIYNEAELIQYAQKRLPQIKIALNEYLATNSDTIGVTLRADIQSPEIKAQQERTLSAQRLSGEFTQEQKKRLTETYQHPQPFTNLEILISSVFLMLSTDDDLTKEDSQFEEQHKLETDVIATYIALLGSIKAGSKTLEPKSGSIKALIQSLPQHFDFKTGELNIRALPEVFLGQKKGEEAKYQIFDALPSAIHSYLIFSFAAVIFLAVSIPVFLALINTAAFTLTQSISLTALAGSAILMTSYCLNKLFLRLSNTDHQIENLKERFRASGSDKPIQLNSNNGMGHTLTTEPQNRPN
ncbi:hypothetical protein N9C31_01430 [Gammaproteobacteria bacterium]|nr:hypothetical protein [Gammaproteobacteria bacterium]